MSSFLIAQGATTISFAFLKWNEILFLENSETVNIFSAILTALFK